MLYYHNVTPAHFFAPFDAGALRLSASRGRRELATLAGRVDLALGVSEYNRAGARRARLPRRRACCRSSSTSDRLTTAPARCRRSSGCCRTAWSTSCSSAASRRTRRSRTTSGWPSTTSATSTSYYRFIFVGQHRRRAALLRRDPRAHRRVPDAAGSLLVHGPGARRGAGGVLSARARVRVAERARGVLRAAGRGDGDGRAGAGLRRGGGARRRSAAPACRSRRRISSTPPSCSARSSTTSRSRQQRASPASAAGSTDVQSRDRFEAAARRRARRDRCLTPHANCFHRSTLRHRDPRRIRVPLPAHRRAARRSPPGRRAHDVRARLHHVEERVPRGRRTASAASPCGASPTRGRATSRRSTSTRTGSSTTRHSRQDELEWLKQQGPWSPGLIEYLERQHQQLRRPDLLHVSLRADGAGHQGRAVQEPARADRARRAGDPARHLPGRLRAAPPASSGTPRSSAGS